MSTPAMVFRHPAREGEAAGQGGVVAAPRRAPPSEERFQLPGLGSDHVQHIIHLSLAKRHQALDATGATVRPTRRSFNIGESFGKLHLLRGAAAGFRELYSGGSWRSRRRSCSAL